MMTTAMLMKEIESLPQECLEEVFDFTIFLKKRRNIGQVVSFAERQISDDDYSAEWEAEDPFFNRATQLELLRRARNMKAGINCSEHEIIEID